jgi:hypothetical protein
MFQNVVDDLKETWRHPFRADMSAVDWFLFVGLLLVIMVLWRIILRHIVEG